MESHLQFEIIRNIGIRMQGGLGLWPYWLCGYTSILQGREGTPYPLTRVLSPFQGDIYRY